MNKDNFCPICGYDIYSKYNEKPWNGDSPSYIICPSCGVEFGYGDFSKTVNERKCRHDQLRQNWIVEGMFWHGELTEKPKDWDPQKQLDQLLS